MGTNFEVTGLKELTENLEKATKKVEEATKEQEVSLIVLFNDKFMKKYTDFDKLYDLLDNYKKDMSSEEFQKQIESEEWNNYIEENTQFSNWDKMFIKAGEEYFKNKLNNIFK